MSKIITPNPFCSNFFAYLSFVTAAASPIPPLVGMITTYGDGFLSNGLK